MMKSVLGTIYAEFNKRRKLVVLAVIILLLICFAVIMLKSESLSSSLIWKDVKYVLKDFVRNARRDLDCYLYSISVPQKNSSNVGAGLSEKFDISIELLGDGRNIKHSFVASGYLIFRQGMFNDRARLVVFDSVNEIYLDTQYKIMSHWDDGTAKYVNIIAAINPQRHNINNLNVVVNGDRPKDVTLENKEVSEFNRITTIKTIDALLVINGKRLSVASSNLCKYSWENGPVRFQTYDLKKDRYLEALFLQNSFLAIPHKKIQLTLKYVYCKESRTSVPLNSLSWKVELVSDIEKIAPIKEVEGLFELFIQGKKIYMYAPWFKETKDWTKIKVDDGQLLIVFTPRDNEEMNIHVGSGNTIDLSFFQSKKESNVFLPQHISVDDYFSFVPKKLPNDYLISYYDPKKVPLKVQAKLNGIVSLFEDWSRVLPEQYNSDGLDSEPSPTVRSLFFRRGASAMAVNKNRIPGRDYRQGDLSYYLSLYFYHFKNNQAKEVALDYARYVCDNGAMSHNQGYWKGSIRYYTRHDYSESVYNRFSGIISAYYLTNNYYYYFMGKRIADAGYKRSTKNGELLAVREDGKIAYCTLSRTPYLSYDYVLAYQTYGEKKYLYLADRLIGFLDYSKRKSPPYWLLAWTYGLSHKSKRWIEYDDSSYFADNFRNYYGYFLSGIYLAYLEKNAKAGNGYNIPYLKEAMETEKLYPRSPSYDSRWAVMYKAYYAKNKEQEYLDLSKQILRSILSKGPKEVNNQYLKEWLLFLPILYQSDYIDIQKTVVQ